MASRTRVAFSVQPAEGSCPVASAKPATSPVHPPMGCPSTAKTVPEVPTDMTTSPTVGSDAERGAGVVSGSWADAGSPRGLQPGSSGPRTTGSAGTWPSVAARTSGRYCRLPESSSTRCRRHRSGPCAGPPVQQPRCPGPCRPAARSASHAGGTPRPSSRRCPVRFPPASAASWLSARPPGRYPWSPAQYRAPATGSALPAALDQFCRPLLRERVSFHSSAGRITAPSVVQADHAVLLAADRDGADVIQAAAASAIAFCSAVHQWSGWTSVPSGCAGPALADQRAGVGVTDHYFAGLGGTVDSCDECHRTFQQAERASVPGARNASGAPSGRRAGARWPAG